MTPPTPDEAPPTQDESPGDKGENSESGDTTSLHTASKPGSFRSGSSHGKLWSLIRQIGVERLNVFCIASGFQCLGF